MLKLSWTSKKWMSQLKVERLSRSRLVEARAIQAAQLWHAHDSERSPISRGEQLKQRERELQPELKVLAEQARSHARQRSQRVLTSRFSNSRVAESGRATLKSRRRS